jgi:hypothetical protein
MVGCAGETAPPPLIPPDVDPSDTDTDAGHPTDTDHGMEDRRRPLCKVEATPPAVAADLAAWIAWLRTSDEKLYGRGRADVLEAMGSDLGDAPGERTANLVERGWNRLRLGDTDGALADLTEAVALAETSAPGLRERARVILASAWMRKAELDNCVSDGTGSACLVTTSTATACSTS